MPANSTGVGSRRRWWSVSSAGRTDTEGLPRDATLWATLAPTCVLPADSASATAGEYLFQIKVSLHRLFQRILFEGCHAFRNGDLQDLGGRRLLLDGLLHRGGVDQDLVHR